MSDTLTPDQYMAKAAATELGYARQTIEEMQREVKRIRSLAANVIRQCDWLLTGEYQPGPDDE